MANFSQTDPFPYPQNIAQKLKQQMEICDIHAQRITIGLRHIDPLLPINEDKIKQFSDAQLGFIELITGRLGKLQDTMGSRLFPLVLELLGERQEQQSVIDRLNILEKLGFITSAHSWSELRSVRNQITHEYDNNYSEQVNKIHYALDAAKRLLTIWQDFKRACKNSDIISDIY